jgi:hypothetical protein
MDPDLGPGGKKLPTKTEKREEFPFIEVCTGWLFRAEASPAAWTSFMEASKLVA